MGFACGRPSRTAVEESASAVELSVFGGFDDVDGLCTTQIVFWYVPVALGEPLWSRRLVDSHGADVEVTDCASQPRRPRCPE